MCLFLIDKRVTVLCSGTNLYHWEELPRGTRNSMLSHLAFGQLPNPHGLCGRIGSATTERKREKASDSCSGFTNCLLTDLCFALAWNQFHFFSILIFGCVVLAAFWECTPPYVLLLGHCDWDRGHVRSELVLIFPNQFVNFQSFFISVFYKLVNELCV